MVPRTLTVGPYIGGPGDLKRIQPNGTVDTLISGLTSPTSVAFGQDGLIYVTDDGESLQNGLVRRYSDQPVPEPGTWAALALGGLALVRRRRSPASEKHKGRRRSPLCSTPSKARRSGRTSA